MARRASAKKKKSLRITLVYLGAIVLLSLTAYVYRQVNAYLQDQFSSFALSDISIAGNHLLTRQQVLELCGLKPGSDRLMEIRPAQVVQNLKESPYISDASAVRSLPSTLRIVISERVPLAFIYGRGLNLIDEEGVLLPVPRDHRKWNLPFITGVKQPLGTLGEKTTAIRALQAVEILAFVRFMQSPLRDLISEIDMSDGKRPSLKFIRGGARVKLNLAHYQQNLFVLDRYLNKFFNWQDLAAVEYFDVRFDNQLIVKKKNG